MSDRGRYLINTFTVFALSIVLFYLPSIIFFFDNGSGHELEHFLGLVLATFYTGGFLLNYFYLVPAMLIKNSRVSVYLTVNLVLVLSIMIFLPLWMKIHGGYFFPHARCMETSLWKNALIFAGFSMRDGIMMILAIALGYALRMGKQRQDFDRKKLELNVERRQLELKNLKTQLNPHFLFNSLNSIYALIAINPDKAQAALHDLSNMLRYMIYETSSNNVPVQKEIELIREFVALMRLRISDKCIIEFNIGSGIPQDLYIAPLIYLTLVENAFKYVSPAKEKYYIRITLNCVENCKIKDFDYPLLFSVSNTFVAPEGEPSEEAVYNGVGLHNIERQLKLLYPGKYSFEVRKGADAFVASLAIASDALRDKGEIK